MLKKTITYTDFNDVERTEDFYFNFTKAEIAEMQFSVGGGLDAVLSHIIQTQDLPSIIREFKNIVQKAYGEKSSDGKHFMKSSEIRERFISTEAYSVLFMELATDADAAAKFINALIPIIKEDKK